jgi:hypothetical protein
MARCLRVRQSQTIRVPRIERQVILRERPGLRAQILAIQVQRDPLDLLSAYAIADVGPQPRYRGAFCLGLACLGLVFGVGVVGYQPVDVLAGIGINARRPPAARA